MTAQLKNAAEFLGPVERSRPCHTLIRQTDIQAPYAACESATLVAAVALAACCRFLCLNVIGDNYR